MALGHRIAATLRNDIYCNVCGWWYPPHTH